jgi:tetratricopeptide (TPR) repeat protein
VFSIQTEIATAIAEALRATLTTEERELLDTVPTENMAALEAYFLGKQHMAKRNVAALAGAIDDFKRAVELDPNFALAYVGLADGYILQVEYSGFPIEEVDAKARPAVERALALDDRLAEAYTSLGGLEDSLNHHEAAEAAFRRALELNPNYVTAYHWYSILLAGPLGRPAEALELIQRAVELDPRSPIILQNVGNCYAGVGRFEESLAWYRNAIEVDPDFPGGHQWIGDHYWRVAGRLDEAARWLRKAVALDPEAAERAATLGLLFLDLGDRDRAEYWIERSLELAPDSFSVNLAMELLRLQQGDRPAALEYGRRAFPSQINYYSFWFNSFRPMRIDELRAGRYREARAAVEKIAPELLNEASPQIGVTNYRAAIDLALILSKTGDPQRADWLLEHSLQYIQGVPRLDSTGYGVADAQIYAVQGNPQQALSALRRAIDEGWRAYWWFYLEYDPILEPLHGEPAYQAMVAEIEADMAAQLAHLREMERNGEVEAYAGVSAAMQ